AARFGHRCSVTIFPACWHCCRVFVVASVPRTLSKTWSRPLPVRSGQAMDWVAKDANTDSAGLEPSN
ncbi:MAG: hypothetical protein ACI855_003405, partial [Myxococcota bacterium]